MILSSIISLLGVISALLPFPVGCSNYLRENKEESFINLASGGGGIENELAAIFRDVAYGGKDIHSDSKDSDTDKPNYTPSSTTRPTPSSKDPRPSIELTTEESSIDINKGAELLANVVDRIPTNQNLSDIDSSESRAGQSVTCENCDNAEKAESLRNLYAELGVGLDVHVYLSGILYSIVGIFILFCLVSLLLSRKYALVIYAIVIYLTTFLATFFRMIQLFYDPYFLGNKLPVYLSDAISGVSLYIPFVGLAVLISSLLRITHLNLIFLSLQFSTIGSIVITILVIIIIIIELLLAVLGHSSLIILRTCTHVLLCACIGAVCIFYVVMYVKVKDAVHKKRESNRMGIYVADAAAAVNERASARLLSATHLALSSVILGIFITALAVFFLSILPHKLIMSHHWAWLAIQSVQNTLEFVMWTCSCLSAYLVIQASQQSNAASTIYSHLPCLNHQSPTCTSSPSNYYKTNGSCSSPRTYYAVCSKPFPNDTMVFLDSSYKPNTQILPANSVNVNFYANNLRKQEFIPFLHEKNTAEDTIYNEIEEYSNNYHNEPNCKERTDPKLGEQLFAFRS